MLMVFDPNVDAARRLGDDAVRLARDTGDKSVLVEVLAQRTWIEIAQQNHAAAAALCEEALRLWRSLADPHRTSLRVLHTDAYRLQARGDATESWIHHEEVLNIARERGNLRQQSVTLACMCQTASEEWTYAESVALLDEAWEIQHALGGPYAEAGNLMSRSIVAKRQGDYAAMRAYCAMTLPRTRRIGYLGFEANALANLAGSAWMLGHVAEAHESLVALVGLQSNRTKRFPQQVPAEVILAAYALQAGDVLSAADSLVEELNRARSREASPALLACVDGHAWLAVACGRSAPGTRLLACTAVIRAGGGPSVEGEGDMLGRAVRKEHARYIELANSDLGADEFDAAWTLGSEMTIEAALSYIDAHAEDWVA
jgi:hypothetical protein